MPFPILWNGVYLQQFSRYYALSALEWRDVTSLVTWPFVS